MGNETSTEKDVPESIVRDVRKTTEIVSDELPTYAFSTSSKEMLLTSENGIEPDRRNYVDFKLTSSKFTSYSSIV